MTLALAQPPPHEKGCDVSVVKDNIRILNTTLSLVDLHILLSLHIFKPRPGPNISPIAVSI